MSFTPFLRRATTATASFALALTAATLPSTTASAASDATPYVLGGGGYGTRVTAGSTIDSGQTALTGIGCNNKVNRRAQASAAAADVPGLAGAKGLETVTRTFRENGQVGSETVNRIARLTIADLGVGTLAINGLESRAKAYRDASGYHAQTDFTLADLTLDPAVGPDVNLPIPAPGQPVTVPGLARISVGSESENASSAGANAILEALKIEVLPAGVTVTAGRASASISPGVVAGTFAGNAVGAEAVAVGGGVNLGRTPFLPMPCVGTAGKRESRSVADLDLARQVALRGLNTERLARQSGTRAYGYTAGRVARVELAGGRLVIDGLVGRANVDLNDGTLTKSTIGTKVGTVTLDGERLELPARRSLEIPGIASLTPRVITQQPRGIKVVALRVELLDGSGAVLELGRAELRVFDSGL